MLENCLSGSEGGGALLSLPLSLRRGVIANGWLDVRKTNVG
jgi:hypothetical protein